MSYPSSILHKTSAELPNYQSLITTTGSGGKSPEKDKFLELFKSIPNSNLQRFPTIYEKFNFSEKESNEDLLLISKITLLLLGDEVKISPEEKNLQYCHSKAVRNVLEFLPRSHELLFLCAAKFDKKSRINLPLDGVYYILRMPHANLNFENFNNFITRKSFYNSFKSSIHKNLNSDNSKFYAEQVKLFLETHKVNERLKEITLPPKELKPLPALEVKPLYIKDNTNDEWNCTIL